ncbi:RNA methyltransferase, TrmH family [Staphylococcus aureus subsp. aureus IS-111]|nr:RNA methyltransferase, TrmH family [Staphylococcus aureus subsp. aureus IS-111]SUJ39649.1 TrmH family tRNA/rRNA methyltransferase YacO [Staphylococcus aureus]
MEDTVIVGRHAVREAIITGHPINKILIQEGIKKQQINEILKNAKDQKIIVQTVPKSKLDFFSKCTTSGCCSAYCTI